MSVVTWTTKRTNRSKALSRHNYKHVKMSTDLDQSEPREWEYSYRKNKSSIKAGFSADKSGVRKEYANGASFMNRSKAMTLWGSIRPFFQDQSKLNNLKTCQGISPKRGRPKFFFKFLKMLYLSLVWTGGPGGTCCRYSSTGRSGTDTRTPPGLGACQTELTWNRDKLVQECSFQSWEQAGDVPTKSQVWSIPKGGPPAI